MNELLMGIVFCVGLLMAALLAAHGVAKRWILVIITIYFGLIWLIN